MSVPANGWRSSSRHSGSRGGKTGAGGEPHPSRMEAVTRWIRRTSARPRAAKERHDGRKSPQRELRRPSDTLASEARSIPRRRADSEAPQALRLRATARRAQALRRRWQPRAGPLEKPALACGMLCAARDDGKSSRMPLFCYLPLCEIVISVEALARRTRPSAPRRSLELTEPSTSNPKFVPGFARGPSK